VFFFEKTNQKTFGIRARVGALRSLALQKFLLMPSHEKNDSSEFASGGQGPAPGPRQRRALDPEI
jgi:hypothetical protein